MKFQPLHRWDLALEDAIALQEALRDRVVKDDRVGPVRFVAGIDASFEDADTVTQAAVAILSFPELALVTSSIARRATTFPYVPGLLSFREAPAVLDALERLDVAPDLILYDGHGVAHPRRFGIACHIGVLTDIPTIGVAKTRLLGEHPAVPFARGSWVELSDGHETVGAVVRTRLHVKPLYVSIGHRVSLPAAVSWVLACSPQYRLPETTRWAHRLASSPARA